MFKIEPKGFFKKMLVNQINGLTGHIEDAGYPFNIVKWGEEDYYADNENPNWWVYEQTAYWLDGFIRCSCLLNIKEQINRGAEIVYKVLNNADNDGYLGPKQLKNLNDPFARWPHVVFFRACIALFEYNHDYSIIHKIESHYLNCKYEYSKGRNVLNVEILLLLYKYTKNDKLLELAISSYEKYNEYSRDDLNDKTANSNKKPYAHGVSYDEYSKLGAILFIYTKNNKYLDASVNAFKKLDKMFMLADGLHCSNEFLISDNILDSHETCCVTDFTWANYYLYEATKNSKYLDKIEACVFNAGFGSITEDFKALQYFSCPNQFILSNTSNHNEFFKGSKWMTYRPNPGTECCPGNVNRFIPNYILNMWEEENNIVILKLFGDSSFKNNYCQIREIFKIDKFKDLKLNIEIKKNFTLKVRIPNWAESFNVLMDNKEINIAKNNGYICIPIVRSCNLSITFDCNVIQHVKHNYMYFTFGPLLYTLKIKSHKVIDRDEKNSSSLLPAYEFYPISKWNYAVENIKTNFHCDNYSIYVETIEVTNWKLKECTKIKRCINLYDRVFDEISGNFIFTTKAPHMMKTGHKRTIKLSPYKFTNLRVTLFPIKNK